MNIKLFLESLSINEREELVNHLQILSKSESFYKTSLENFIKYAYISVRLKNILEKYNYYNNSQIEYLEDIQFTGFMKCRNAGKKSWEELWGITELVGTSLKY